MKIIPETTNTPVLRTEYSDEAAWQAVRAAIEQPGGRFRANVQFISDDSYAGIAAEALLALIPAPARHACIFLVDAAALANPEHPILVMDLFEEPGRTFRVIPSEMWGIENNLSIANMDFAEFAEAVDPDGVFRGFRRA
jgi:hypothetical protein